MPARRLWRSFRLSRNVICLQLYLKGFELKMAAEVTSKEVEDVLRERLLSLNYTVNVERKNGETGTDIEARRGDEILHIEAIAFKSSPPARSKDFYEAFFRAISSLDHGATTCVITLPAR